jgi:SAM-dependent methyltransferase
MNDRARSLAFWDREVLDARTTWLHDPQVRDYVLHAVGGERPQGSLDWLEEQLAGRRFRRALSVGCGSGGLDRDLMARGLCERIDAFDGSIQSVAIASRQAPHGVRYFVADFNEPRLERETYDAVIFNQSLHHVAKLEKLLRRVLQALTADGLVYLDEYVGPSSTSWNPTLARHHRMAYGLVPPAARRFAEVPYPIMPDDPSEAIRSGEILEQLQIGFDIVAERDYGGNVLAPLYANIDWAHAPESVVAQLIEVERQVLAEGEPSYYKLILARPKRGAPARWASCRYFVEPKLKRIGRMLR